MQTQAAPLLSPLFSQTTKENNELKLQKMLQQGKAKEIVQRKSLVVYSRYMSRPILNRYGTHINTKSNNDEKLKHRQYHGQQRYLHSASVSSWSPLALVAELS